MFVPVMSQRVEVVLCFELVLNELVFQQKEVRKEKSAEQTDMRKRFSLSPLYEGELFQLQSSQTSI